VGGGKRKKKHGGPRKQLCQKTRNRALKQHRVEKKTKKGRKTKTGSLAASFLTNFPGNLMSPAGKNRGEGDGDLPEALWGEPVQPEVGGNGQGNY